MKTLLTVSAGLVAALLVGAALAQQPDQPRQVQGRGGFGFGGPFGTALLNALDTDGDREISAEEIENASKALAKLDKDGNGKLTSDELRVVRPRPDADTLVAGMLERSDKNGDGKISGDEITDRMRAFAERVDTDDDGALTKEELKKYYSNGPGSGGRGSGPGEFLSRFFEQNDKNGDGKLAGDEITDRMKRLVERFDADADGVLTKKEIESELQNMNARPSGEGRGGRRRPNGEDRSRDRPDVN
jgi:Ca2+-binding EF-hand superfamily protein